MCGGGEGVENARYLYVWVVGAALAPGELLEEVVEVGGAALLLRLRPRALLLLVLQHALQVRQEQRREERDEEKRIQDLQQPTRSVGWAGERVTMVAAGVVAAGAGA